MPKGPNGEIRPSDAIGCAVTVAKIATGEVKETSQVSQATSEDNRLRLAGHGGVEPQR